MACLHPALILKYKLPSDEKWNVQFFRDKYADEIPEHIEFSRRQYLRNGFMADVVSVPCGNCFNCRMSYARQWASRCALESTMYDRDRSFFVTLTYDNDHLHISEKTGLPSLFYDDMTKFLKRLRRYNQYHFGDDNIRFYYCGEYGDSTARPHYHILLFNVSIPDLKIISHNKFGNALYTSSVLEELWTHGLVCVGELNWNTAAYTARYVMKKHKGFDQFIYNEADIAVPKVQMSRKPGIGVPWMQSYGSNLFTQKGTDQEGFPIFHDSILIPTNGDTIIYSKPPRLFEKYASVDGEQIVMCKEMRKRVAELLNESRKAQVMESDREYFSKLEDSLLKSQKGFIRKFQELC